MAKIKLKKKTVAQNEKKMKKKIVVDNSQIKKKVWWLKTATVII